jgi:hypothetical protein
LGSHDAVIQCDRCGREAEAIVAEGPSGPFVVVTCYACHRVRTPYLGPGHEQVIRQWRTARRLATRDMKKRDG